MSTPILSSYIEAMKEKIEVFPKATYSSKEVMAILGISEKTLQRRTSAKLIKYAVLGNKRIFWGKDVLNYIKSLQPK